MNRVCLSKRNLLTLLSKVARCERGESTECTPIKNQGQPGPYQQTMDKIYIIGVPDSLYYGAEDREPSPVHPIEESRIDGANIDTVKRCLQIIAEYGCYEVGAVTAFNEICKEFNIKADYDDCIGVYNQTTGK